MKYFIATKFLEGPQKNLFGYTKPTIDLISIGIKCEDGREYYAISKDFNLKEAWNRYELKEEWYSINNSTQSTRNRKVYWIRDNVLKPIFNELSIKEYYEFCNLNYGVGIGLNEVKKEFTYKNLKRLINKYGKTNKQIAEEILHFTNGIYTKDENGIGTGLIKDNNQQFYGYYADYDWVVFCWLFGKMIDLPNGFPKYCVDLKQILDEQEDIRVNTPGRVCGLKGHPNYPKQTNEHNALSDARFNYELYKFLKTL